MYVGSMMYIIIKTCLFTTTYKHVFLFVTWRGQTPFSKSVQKTGSDLTCVFFKPWTPNKQFQMDGNGDVFQLLQPCKGAGFARFMSPKKTSQKKNPVDFHQLNLAENWNHPIETTIYEWMIIRFQVQIVVKNYKYGLNMTITIVHWIYMYINIYIYICINIYV